VPGAAEVPAYTDPHMLLASLLLAAGERTQSALAVYKVRDNRIVSVWYYEVMP
jgi:hypothetical protein